LISESLDCAAAVPVADSVTREHEHAPTAHPFKNSFLVISVMITLKRARRRFAEMVLTLRLD
jgi:hypothetical protein